ncbi:MAG: hypothetical protein PHV48_04310 [Candidatus Omnitrophica bacterium]|nr:hypothetical protein [Candidatus Omnitrophota bacterium]
MRGAGGPEAISKTSILVTGGFHTENLAELFKKQGISYVSIIPNFKNSDGYECPYFNILSGADKTQLVKAVPAMLAGNMATASQLNPTLRDAVEEFGGAPIALPPSAARAILRQQNVKHSDILPFLKSLNMPDVTVINFDTHPDDGLADEEAAPGNWVRAAKERRLIGDVYWVLPEQENAAKLYGMTPEELRKTRHDATITYATSDINDRRLADIKGPIVVSIDFDYLSFTGFKRLTFKIGFLRRIAIRKEIERIFNYLTQNNIQVAAFFFAESGPEYVPESDKVFIDRELNSAYRRYIDKVEVSASAAARVQNPRHEVPSGPGPSAAKDSDGTNLIPKETIEKWLDERNIEIPQPGTMAHSLMGQVAIKESTAQTLSDISTQSNDEAVQSNVAALFMPMEKRFTPVGRDRNTLIEETLDNLKIKPSEVTGILLEGGRVEIRPLGKGEFRYVNHVIIKTAQKEYHFTSSTNYRSDDLGGHLRIAEEYSYLKLIRDKYKYIERFQEPLAIGMFDYKGIKRRVILKEFKPGMDMKQFLTARLSGQMNDNDIANLADVMYDWGRCLADVYNATGGYITDPHPKNFVVNDAVIPPVISIIDAEDFRDGLPDNRIFDVVSQQLAHIERSISENPLRRQILLMHPTIEKVLSKAYLSGFISNYITNHDLDVEKFLNSMDETAPQVGLLIGDILSKDSAMRENIHIKNLSVLSTIFTAKPAELPSLRHKNISNVDLSLPKSRFGVSGVNIAYVLISALNEELKIADPANAPIVSVIGSLSYALTDTGDIDWDAIGDFDLRVHTDKPLSKDAMQRITVLFYNKLRALGVNVQTTGVEEADAFTRSILMQKWGISESSGKAYRTQILFADEKNLFEGEAGFDSYRPTDLFFGNTERLNTILNKVGLDAIVARTEIFYKSMLKDAQREYRDSNWPNKAKVKLLKQFYQLAYLRGEKLFWLLNAYKELSNKYDEQLFVESYEEAIDKLLRIGDDQLREELSKNIQNLSIIAAVAPAPTKPLESAGIGEVGPASTKPLESAGIGEVGPARLPVLRSSESEGGSPEGEVPGGSGLSAEKTDDVERIVNTCVSKIRDRLLNKIGRGYRAFKDIDITAMSKEELEDARAKFEICPITTKIAHVLLCKTLARMPRFEMSMWASPFDLGSGRGQNSMHFWNEIRDTSTGRRFYVSFADGQFEDKWIARVRVVDITDEVKRNGLLESMQILPHKAATIGIGEINNVLGVDGAQAIAVLAAREVPSAVVTDLSGLLAKEYVTHDMAVKNIVNPNNAEGLVAVYGGSGADISNFLLSTNVQKAYFVDQSMISYNRIKILKEKWVSEGKLDDLAGYRGTKYRDGYASSSNFEMSEIELKILLELKAIGVDPANIIIEKESKGITIGFNWQYPGSDVKEYSITFISASIENWQKYPPLLANALDNGIDIYYQRAGFEIPSKYGEFIQHIADGIREGGFLVTDDRSKNIANNSFDERNAGEFLGKDFTLLNSEQLIDSGKAIIDIKQNEERISRESGWVNYGWDVKIRQKQTARAVPQAIEERREALIAAANTTDGRDKIVKIIVGRPEGDEFESPFQSTSRKISQMLAKNGYGLVESSMDKGGSQRCDESQVYYYTIFRDDPDGKRTMSSIDSSVKDAQSDMKRDGVAGRIILFASEMEEERGPKVFNAARSAYAKEAMVVPDAYTDMSAKDILYEGAQSYPDIVARVVLGRAIAFYYDGGNKEETVKLIKLLLEKITAADVESILVVKDGLLEFLKPIRIRPVDYRNITDWRDAQEALAQSA